MRVELQRQFPLAAEEAFVEAEDEFQQSMHSASNNFNHFRSAGHIAPFRTSFKRFWNAQKPFSVDRTPRSVDRTSRSVDRMPRSVDMKRHPVEQRSLPVKQKLHLTRIQCSYVLR